MERGSPASQAAAERTPADGCAASDQALERAEASAPDAEPAQDSSQAPDERLAPLRERIDALDGQLLALLSERARLAQQVGEIKRDTGAPVYRPERERQVIDNLAARNPGPLPGAAIEAVWREIMSACRDLERRLRVAYLGPEGTFSEQALRGHFGSSVDAMACASFDEVFRAAEAGGVDYAVVPVENSTEGAVNRNLDLLLETPLKICGEVSLPIAHHLLTRDGTLGAAARVCAHPQALAQCAGWLSRHAALALRCSFVGHGWLS